MKQLNNRTVESSHFESLYPEDSRFEEIEQILSYVKEGNSCQVISLPGVGRSNLFGLLSYNRGVRLKHLGENQEWFHFILVNFSEIRKKPLTEATKFLFLSLIDSLRERGLNEESQKTNSFLKEALPFTDELVLFQGLKRVTDYLAIEKELTVVFLFDRFEEYVPMLTNDFFANLRVLRNRAKYRFSIVFSLNRPLEDMLEPSLFADFYEFLAGHAVYLPLLDKKGLDFRLAYLEKVSGKKIPEDQKNKLIELTAGHGKLTRLCAETLLTKNYELGVKNNKLEHLIEQKPVRGALFEIWNALRPAEQTHLTKGLFSKEYEDEHTSYLEKVGLVKDGKIAILLFEIFVQEQKSATEQLSNRAMVYDSERNEIKRRNAILSDQLSALEFRLLKFLLQNQNRIIQREELVNAVWTDVQSQAGVTDQAIDQLIYRLRRKIEEDPNNPKQLQTIKGRGVKFTS